MIQHAKEGTSKRKYYETKMKSDPFALFSSVKEMIKYMLSEPKVLMWTQANVGDKRMKPLNIMDSVRSPGAFAYPKGSEFRRMFDFHLLKMKQSGVADKIALKYMPDPPQVVATTVQDLF